MSLSNCGKFLSVPSIVPRKPISSVIIVYNTIVKGGAVELIERCEKITFITNEGTTETFVVSPLLVF